MKIKKVIFLKKLITFSLFQLICIICNLIYKKKKKLLRIYNFIKNSRNFTDPHSGIFFK